MMRIFQSLNYFRLLKPAPVSRSLSITSNRFSSFYSTSGAKKENLYRFKRLTQMSVRRNTNGTGSANTVANSSKNTERESFGIPWGLIISVSVIGGLIGWFYRSYKNGKLLEKFREKLKNEIALSPDEIEEFRNSNKLEKEIFDELVKKLKQQLPGVEKMALDEFIKTTETILKEEYGKEGIKASHFIERLVLFIQDYNKGAPVSMDFCFLVLTLLLDSSVEERIERIYEIYSRDGKLDMKAFEKLLSDLKLSFQLPVRVLSKEVKEYPLNKYVAAEPKDMLTNGFKNVVKHRKKEKTLEENFKEKQSLYEKGESDVKVELEDFKDLLLSNGVCAWGECN